MLSKQHRLPGYRIPEILKSKHRVAHGSTITVHIQKQTITSDTRLTIICPVKLSKRAVKRNRTKRIIREIIRLNQSSLHEGFDAVVIAKTLLDKTTQDTQDDVTYTLKKSGVL